MFHGDQIVPLGSLWIRRIRSLSHQTMYALQNSTALACTACEQTLHCISRELLDFHARARSVVQTHLRVAGEERSLPGGAQAGRVETDKDCTECWRFPLRA